MTQSSMLDATASANLPIGRGRASARTGRPRLVLLQTQAEAAGAQEISRILGDGLAARGYDVHHVFLFRRTAAFDHLPNTFFAMPMRPQGITGLARMAIALVHHLKRLRPDAVVCFQHYGNIAGTLAARLAGIDTVIANRTTARSLVPRWAQMLEVMLGRAGLLDRLVVNSKAVEEEYCGYPGGWRSRVLRIDHGFAPKVAYTSRAAAREQFDLPAQATLLGSVARLHPGKNLAAAVRLLPFDRAWHLALAGQGPDRERLARLATSLGVADRVHFVGELVAGQVSVFLRALDVFVFPSLAETFGLAAVEAAQSGVPVLANDLPVLREVLAVEGAPCALFADVNDPDAFAASIRALLSDADLRVRLSAPGRMLSQRYSVEAMIDQYAALIEHLLPSGKGARA